jgi:hypothetical protein
MSLRSSCQYENNWRLSAPAANRGNICRIQGTAKLWFEHKLTEHAGNFGAKLWSWIGTIAPFALVPRFGVTRKLGKSIAQTRFSGRIG